MSMMATPVTVIADETAAPKETQTSEVTKKEELKEELSSIKKVVDNLKKEKKHNKNSDLVSKRTINKLENIINEKNENIMMINEELESFLRQNYLLKKKVKDKEFTIVTLEMKIKKDKEKENILNNSNSNNSNIIPINNLEEGQQQ
jgi:predicted RNase H-like nuclease (RuvC/YqgF family)